MALLAAAFGTSHSPALNSEVEDYRRHAEIDQGASHWKRQLLDRQGNPCSYDELVGQAKPDIADEITDEKIAERVARCNSDIARLRDAIAAAKLDALIIVGDDQREQFDDGNMPAILLYWGETIRNEVLQIPDDAPDWWRRSRAQFHEESQAKDYPVASALGEHVIGHLMDNGFDISHATELQRDRGEGHAFGFFHRRLMTGDKLPVLPVLLNTYYPPNQPRPARCYELGRELRAAVESCPGNARVGVLASGGLSHFTIDEELDIGVLDACQRADGEALKSIPVQCLNSGNSEIRNWIATAGAAEGLNMTWRDYVPCYRSPAGTGCGMAFAVWS